MRCARGLLFAAALLMRNKNEAATAGNPDASLWAARNQNRFQGYCVRCSFHSQFSAAGTDRWLVELSKVQLSKVSELSKVPGTFRVLLLFVALIGTESYLRKCWDLV